MHAAQMEKNEPEVTLTIKNDSLDGNHPNTSDATVRESK